VDVIELLQDSEGDSDVDVRSLLDGVACVFCASSSPMCIYLPAAHALSGFPAAISFPLALHIVTSAKQAFHRRMAPLPPP